VRTHGKSTGLSNGRRARKVAVRRNCSSSTCSSASCTALEARALRKALEETAAYRGTELLPLTDTLDTLPTARQASWRAFVERTGLTDVLPDSFDQAVRQVSEFVDPIVRGDPGLDRWNPSARAWT
jgi:hypothetical protein